MKEREKVIQELTKQKLLANSSETFDKPSIAVAETITNNIDPTFAPQSANGVANAQPTVPKVINLGQFGSFAKRPRTEDIIAPMKPESKIVFVNSDVTIKDETEKGKENSSETEIVTQSDSFGHAEKKMRL
jgi:hypothetical protein